MTSSEQTRTSWDRIADGYDEFVTTLNMTMAEVALQRVGLRQGMQVLDVAAGSGALSLPAARFGAHVVATDISQVMIEQLTARAQTEGLSTLEGRVMDGQALDLEDDTFDLAASQFGVMLFPDLPRGLREMARVTRPGGRVLIVAFGPPDKVEFLSYFLAAVQAADPDFTGLQSNLPFQVADPDVLRQRMTEAGLRDVQIETANYAMQVGSGQEHWDIVTSSNPLGAAMVVDLNDEQKAAVQHQLEATLRERSGGRDHAVLNNQVNIGIGTK